MREGLLATNPSDGILRPHYQHEEMQFLDEGEVSQLLLAAQGNRYEGLYWLAVKFGLRQGELLGLKWTDLDWKRRTLHVQRQAKWLKGKGWTFPEPKTHTGRHTTLLGARTLQVLRAHLEGQISE